MAAAEKITLFPNPVGNRPIQGYRRHISKGAKPLGRARGQTYSAARKQAVLCLLLPSFIDFLTLRGFDIIQKVLLAILEHFLRFCRCRDKQKKSLNIKTF